jgi:YVTN family beta-propeller protein
MKKLARFLLKALGALIALIFLAIVALNIYLSMRPPAKTMKAAGIVSIPTPFRLGRPFIDYMTISGSHLYAGYASEGLVGVVDMATNNTVTTVDGLTRVHGIAIVADRNLGFASSSGDNVVGVFDLNTNKLLQKIPAGDDPDAIIYDEQAHLVYVANHNGKTGMLIDPATLKVVATIPLGGEPEYPQADPATGLIYQNLEDTSELVMIDPQKQAVVKRYKLDPGEGPTGLALDATNHRLFSTAGNRKLIVLNT